MTYWFQSGFCWCQHQRPSSCTYKSWVDFCDLDLISRSQEDLSIWNFPMISLEPIGGISLNLHGYSIWWPWPHFQGHRKTYVLEFFTFFMISLEPIDGISPNINGYIIKTSLRSYQILVTLTSFSRSQEDLNMWNFHCNQDTSWTNRWNFTRYRNFTGKHLRSCRDGQLTYTLDYQSRGCKIDPPLLRSFGWDFKPRSRLRMTSLLVGR